MTTPRTGQDNNLPYFFAYFQLPYKFTKIILHDSRQNKGGGELWRLIKK